MPKIIIADDEYKEEVIIMNDQEYVFRPVDEDECLMTLEEFIGACNAGGFIDYDGFGEYAFADKVSNKPVNPSDISAGNVDESFTHVAWYNK